MTAKMRANITGMIEQPDQEALVGDRGHELAAGDERDLLRTHARASSPPAACSAAARRGRRLVEPAAAGDDVMNTSSRRSRAIFDPRRRTSAAAGHRERRLGAVDQRDRVAAALRGLDGRHPASPRCHSRRRRRADGSKNPPEIELTAQAGHRLIEHLAALVDHEHVIAHLLGVGHDVRREENRGAARVRAQRPSSRSSRTLTGSRPLNGSSKMSSRLVQDRAHELHALQHALRQIVAGRALGAAQADALEQIRHARRRGLRATPLSCAR